MTVTPTSPTTVINSDVVQSTLTNFLAQRKLGSWDTYFQSVHQGALGVTDKLTCDGHATWFVLPLAKSALRSTDARLDRQGYARAWHGFKLESLAAMLTHGLRASGPEVAGARFEHGEATLYCCADNHVQMAAGYCNSVPGDGGLYWSGMWELAVNRYDNKKCKRPGQWRQPPGSYCRQALWVRVVRLREIPDGEAVQAFWEPLIELPPSTALPAGSAKLAWM